VNLGNPCLSPSRALDRLSPLSIALRYPSWHTCHKNHDSWCPPWGEGFWNRSGRNHSSSSVVARSHLLQRHRSRHRCRSSYVVARSHLLQRHRSRHRCRQPRRTSFGYTAGSTSQVSDLPSRAFQRRWSIPPCHVRCRVSRQRRLDPPRLWPRN
jgi:hypothetical protein